jgi:hypothetical protein
MKKNLAYLLFFVVLNMGLFQSCTGNCVKPGNRVTVTIPIDLGNSGLDCQLPSDALLNSYKAKLNTTHKGFTSQRSEQDKWIIEVFVAGSCDAEKAWNDNYTKGSWLPGTGIIGNKEFFTIDVPEVPQSNGEVLFMIKILSPCLDCNGTSVRNSFTYDFKAIPKSGRSTVVYIQNSGNVLCN